MEHTLQNTNYSEKNENERKIQKIKFCIISNFKGQVCKNNLILFTLDNSYNYYK